MENQENKKTIGLVIIPRISVGGGFPRVVVETILTLQKIGYDVSMVTPYPIDFDKVAELYEPITLKKKYYPSKVKQFFCRDSYLARRFIKKEFIHMANEVDLILDFDGGIVHNWLPKDFDNSKYIIWRLSGLDKDLGKIPMKRTFRMKLKELLKKTIFTQNPPSKNHKIYSVDKWTNKELKKWWNVDAEEKRLYTPIQVRDLSYDNQIKKDQIVILGRIAPNKKIDDSIRIFAKGAKEFLNYKLIIIGGETPDTKEYIAQLKELAEKLNISDKVQIILNPPYEKIKKTLLDSKVLIDSQRDVSITMTAVEALAAGAIILTHKNTGNYLEALEEGTYGFGFLSVDEGAQNLKNILTKIKNNQLTPTTFNQRAQYFSHENFKERLTAILSVTKK